MNSTGGQVLVNQGDGYRQVAGSMQVKAGDSVVVNPGGSGQIVYSDGCTVQVQPGAVATIAEQSPCASGGSAINGTTFAIGAVVVGGGVAAAVLLGDQKKDKSASP